MISKDKTYRTRDGHEVRIYATDGGQKYCVHGSVHHIALGWICHTWMPDGRSNMPANYDLIEVKPRHKRTVWVTVWNNGYTETSNKPEWRNGSPGCGQEPIACIKVDLDFEEGEGL